MKASELKALLGKEKLAGLIELGEGIARRSTDFALRAGSNDPLGTAATVGGAVAFGPTMLREAVRPSQDGILRKSRRNAMAQQLRGSKLLKSASRQFTAPELEQGLSIRRALEKVASGLRPLPRSWGNITKEPAKLFAAGALLSAGMAAGGAASAAVSGAAGKITEKAHDLALDKNYQAMIKADPSLRSDPRAKAYFATLHRMSPYISGEPQIAASTIKTMLDSAEGYAMSPKAVGDLLSVEERRQKTRYPALRVPTLRGELGDLA